MVGVRSHHLVLRLGVDMHHTRVTVGNSLTMKVFVEKGLHILNICLARSKSESSLFLKDNC